MSQEEEEQQQEQQLFHLKTAMLAVKSAFFVLAKGILLAKCLMGAMSQFRKYTFPPGGVTV